MIQPKARITALDFARGLAIWGMIIVNYKLAMQAEHRGPVWLQSIAGLFEGRASALFVALAGIGVSLMTARARNAMNRELIQQNRKSLYKRSAFLFLAGMLLIFMDWSADILHYYAAFMLIAALLVTVSDRRILAMFFLVLLASQIFLVVFDYSKGWDSSFRAYTGLWTWEGFFRNLLFNGFHPLFPWLSFFLFGIWIGRKPWLNKEHRLSILLYSLCGTFVFETLSYLLIQWTSPALGNDSAQYLFGTKPMPPTMLYVLSGLCLAMAVIAICLYIVDAFEQSVLTQAIIHTGQLSLSHYIGHVVIGLGLLDLFNMLENGQLGFAMTYGSIYFLAAMFFSHQWRQRISRGPIELLMRKCS